MSKKEVRRQVLVTVAEKQETDGSEASLGTLPLNLHEQNSETVLMGMSSLNEFKSHPMPTTNVIGLGTGMNFPYEACPKGPGYKDELNSTTNHLLLTFFSLFFLDRAGF